MIPKDLWSDSGKSNSTHVHQASAQNSSGAVEVSIFSRMGQKMRTLFKGHQLNGTHQLHYINRYAAANTPLIYRIEAQGKSYTGKFVMNQ